MSLIAKINDLANRIAAEFKAVRTEMSSISGGSGASVKSVVLDFGSTGVASKTFTFANASAKTTSNIVMNAVAPADGRPIDEMEMDMLTCAAKCAVNGTITAVVMGNPGPIVGKYTFNYILG